MELMFSQQYANYILSLTKDVNSSFGRGSEASADGKSLPSMLNFLVHILYESLYFDTLFDCCQREGSHVAIFSVESLCMVPAVRTWPDEQSGAPRICESARRITVGQRQCCRYDCTY